MICKMNLPKQQKFGKVPENYTVKSTFFRLQKKHRIKWGYVMWHISFERSCPKDLTADWKVEDNWGQRPYWPLKAKLLIWKRIERFFLNSSVITYTSKWIFWTKILRGCVTSCRFSLQKFFKKWTFFKFFCIFGISLTSWLEKWS